MKLCKGCKHFEAIGASGICHVDNFPLLTLRTDSYTGKTWYGYTRREYKYGAPFVDEMRAVGGKCGPDAVLYEASLTRRFFNKLFGRASNDPPEI